MHKGAEAQAAHEMNRRRDWTRGLGCDRQRLGASKSRAD